MKKGWYKVRMLNWDDWAWQAAYYDGLHNDQGAPLFISTLGQFDWVFFDEYIFIGKDVEA